MAVGHHGTGPFMDGINQLINRGVIRVWGEEGQSVFFWYTLKGNFECNTSFRHVVEPLPPAKVVGILAVVLDVQEAELCQRRCGSLLRAAVSIQVRRLPGLLEGDRRLRRLIKDVERRLKEQREG